jgi:prophage regulatory protein
MTKKFNRSPAVRARLGIAPSTFYLHIKNGVMVPGISLGPRARGYPEEEIDAIVAARTAGHSEDQIRALVKSLVAARQPA